jgi:hypothetical protein
MFICISLGIDFCYKEDLQRTSYGMKEPLNSAIRIFDEFSVFFLNLVGAGTVLEKG